MNPLSSTRFLWIKLVARCISSCIFGVRKILWLGLVLVLLTFSCVGCSIVAGLESTLSLAWKLWLDWLGRPYAGGEMLGLYGASGDVARGFAALLTGINGLDGLDFGS